MQALQALAGSHTPYCAHTTHRAARNVSVRSSCHTLSRRNLAQLKQTSALSRPSRLRCRNSTPGIAWHLITAHDELRVVDTFASHRSCDLTVKAGRITASEPWWEKNNPPNMKSITSVQEMVDAMVSCRPQLDTFRHATMTQLLMGHALCCRQMRATTLSLLTSTRNGVQPAEHSFQRCCFTQAYSIAASMQCSCKRDVHNRPSSWHDVYHHEECN